MRVTIAKLYARTRNDGAVTLSGRMGYDGRLRVEPNPDYEPGNEKSPEFLAFIEYAEPRGSQTYTGPQLQAPARRPSQLVEGEIVE